MKGKTLGVINKFYDVTNFKLAWRFIMMLNLHHKYSWSISQYISQSALVSSPVLSIRLDFRSQV
jgi:hypothetical protein